MQALTAFTDAACSPERAVRRSTFCRGEAVFYLLDAIFHGLLHCTLEILVREVR